MQPGPNGTKFPIINATDYGSAGAIDETPRNWYSWSANGTYTRLAGKHTLKFGGDYRLIGIDTQSFSGSSGVFNFDRRYTSAVPTANGVNGASPSGNAMASMLLGLPSGSPDNQSRLGVSNPFNAYVHYFGAYAQDDWRLQPEDDPQLRPPPGTRVGSAGRERLASRSPSTAG